MDDNFDYIIYTDGAYSNMNNEGAFAYVILNGLNNTVVKKNAWKITDETNNRAELKAIITALYHLPQDAKNVIVYSDSQYALNTLSGIYIRRANKDLFDVFDKIMASRDIDVKYKWVRGHSGDEWNELCDKMCNEVLGYDANAEFLKYKRK